jgi:hypothetical protein
MFFFTSYSFNKALKIYCDIPFLDYFYNLFSRTERIKETTIFFLRFLKIHQNIVLICQKSNFGKKCKKLMFFYD